MKKAINIGLVALMLFAVSAQAQKSVKIGNQVWMSENLNDASKGGKCYENKPESCKKYGRLYTWGEAMKACPSGWHLPSDAEWEALVSFAGGKNAAGRKLKAKNGWEGGGGSDEYGFSALPGGSCGPDGSFYFVGNFGNWWSAAEYDTGSAYFWYMSHSDSKVVKVSYGRSGLLSVRCVKD